MPYRFKAHLRRQTQQGSLGTFSGVFTPSILTILGIILFLRLGYVVGNGGLARALMIIGLAQVISILTSFSLSAIATNLKVKGGGDYYLISRTLGLEFGGAIGTVLFLAQSVSIAFYCLGFGEALTGILQTESQHSPQIIAALAIAFLFIFAWLGADWATRFQYVVMAILAAALLSFFIGGLTHLDATVLRDNWAAPPSSPGFWILFAIFFPAVTGFTQGVSMSGDLKDAGRSLPLGTFLAVGISILVYFGSSIVFASVLPGSILATDYGAMSRVALYGPLIHAGVISATLSSAMASFLGAPRILQSLSQDRILPFLLPFAKGYGPTGNPRRGVLLSAGIALATIGLGNLNLIAPVVSMFFLISYGLLNYATYFEARTASPSFRPRFRWFAPWISLLGCLACLGVILAIDMRSAAVSIAVLFAIYQYLKRTAGPARWADSRRSYHLQRVRVNLLAASEEPEHPRDWRPQLLAFSNDSHRRGQLLRFACWLEGGSGLTTVVKIVEGDGIRVIKAKEAAEKELSSDIRSYGLKAFPLVVVAPNLDLGIAALVQAYGIGPLHANTVLWNWLEEPPKGMPGIRELQYSRSLKSAFRLGSNIIVLKAAEEEWNALESVPTKDRRIDIWWWGDATSRLMLLLAHLMRRSGDWEDVKIRLLKVSGNEDREQTMDALRKRLEEVRIDAEPMVLKHAGAGDIVKESKGASLVFLPFRLSGGHLIGPFGGHLEDLLDRLPITGLFMAAEDIELDAEPEEGKAGEMATAIDTLTDAEKRAKKAEKTAIKTAEHAEEKIEALEEKIPGDDEELQARRKDALEAKEKAEKAARKAAKTRAKAKEAAKAAEEVGAKTPDEEENKSEK